MATSAVTRRFLTVWSQAVAVLATAVMYVALAVAAVLILHIALVVLDANGANPIVTAVRRLADKLVGPFAQLFTPQDAKQQVAINYGLAAAVYLAAGGAVSSADRALLQRRRAQAVTSANVIRLPSGSVNSALRPTPGSTSIPSAVRPRSASCARWPSRSSTMSVSRALPARSGSATR